MAEFKEDCTILPFDAPVPSNAIDSAQLLSNKISNSENNTFFMIFEFIYSK